MLNSRLIAVVAYSGHGGRWSATDAFAKTIAVRRGWRPQARHDEVKDHS